MSTGAQLVDSLLPRCRFPESSDTAAVCAVSGGPDSSALLVLARAAGLEVEAVHVDHGLRPGSDREADVVAALADRFGCRFRAETAPVADGPDLEARCRDARRAAVGDGALYGHTLDDRAETVIWHLARGSGLSGVAAIDPGTHPLLAIRRADTHALCDALGIEVVVDPTNASSRFTRNRIRHELIPLLADIAGRDVGPALARFADLARDDDEFLEALSAEVDVTDARALAAAPNPLSARAVRRWFAAADPGNRPPSAAAVARVLEVARGEAVAADVEAGWRVERHQQRLQLVRVGGAPAGRDYRARS